MFFGIDTGHPTSFEVMPGASETIRFAVTNRQAGARNLGFRATPVKPGGDEAHGAPEAGWLETEPRDSTLVNSGGQVDSTVRVAVPGAVAPGHTFEFHFVAYDSDQSGADEVSSASATFTVKVAGSVVVDEEDDAPVAPKPPWWAFMPAVGLLVFYVIIAVVASSGDNRGAWILLPIILTPVGALGLLIASSIMGRKKAPIDQATYNYGWVATMLSATGLLFALIISFYGLGEADSPEGGLIALIVVLVLLVAAPLPVSILVIKRQSNG